MLRPDESFDHMIYVRLIEACNLHCAHCFIPNNPKRMSWAEIEAMPAKIREFAKPGQRLLFQFHGGEPTLYGVEELRKVCVYLLMELEGFEVAFSIQTNLMNFDLRWADLYREFFNSNIGISWDYQIRQMKAGRPETNVAFESRFWSQVNELHSQGIDSFMVITVTKPLIERFANPRELMDLLISKGVKRVHFERLTKTGYAITNWDWLGVSNREYSNWIGRFSVAYLRFQDEERSTLQPLNVSPLDGLIESVKQLRSGKAEGGYGCLSGACDSRFHTFDQTGYYSACTALTSESNNRNSVGEAIVDTSSLVEQREIRQLSCTDCRYKPICSSGCMATPKIDESNECAGGYLAFKLLNGCLASREEPRLIAITG